MGQAIFLYISQYCNAVTVGDIHYRLTTVGISRPATECSFLSWHIFTNESCLQQQGNNIQDFLFTSFPSITLKGNIRQRIIITGEECPVGFINSVPFYYSQFL
ncbi:hypothetical protein VPH35_068060 [Triticum aestivum]